MDHMDWLDASASQTVAQELSRAVAPGGRIIWRSAAMIPPYNQFIANAGFQVPAPVPFQLACTAMKILAICLDVHSLQSRDACSLFLLSLCMGTCGCSTRRSIPILVLVTLCYIQ